MRVAVVTVLCVVAGASPANATVFNVTKQTDGGGACLVGNCSLRAAVLASNGAPGTNTINVPPGDYTLTVTGASEDAAATGDLDVLHGDVTIVGTGGAAATAIHGSGDRIFDVPATGANTSALTLSGLTLTGGGGVRFGAAVEVDTRTKLTLSHDVVTTNKPVAKLTVATHYAHNHDGSIVISATVNGAGRIRVRDATPTGRHHKARVASLSKTVTKATTIKLTIKPSAAAKAALRHHRSVSVRLRVTFTPKGTSSASAASRTKTVSLQVTALRSKHH